MDSKPLGRTILTSKPTDEVVESNLEREQNYGIVRMLCECWYESLEDTSISCKRAVKEITDMVEINILKGNVTKAVGRQLIGEYAIKCFGVVEEGPSNGVPTALVKLLRESAERLPNPKTSNLAGDSTIYERHSARLAEYGITISSSTLRRWFEACPP